MFKKTLKWYTIEFARIRSHFLQLCCASYFMHIANVMNENLAKMNRVKLMEGGVLMLLDEAMQHTPNSINLIVFILTKFQFLTEARSIKYET